jgi:hypothetical protein
MRSRFVVCLLGVACAVPMTSAAQEPDGDVAGGRPAPPPLYIAAIEGEATLTRNGQIDLVTATQLLLEGDRVRTGSGRLELRDDRGFVLFIGDETVVDLAAPGSLRVLGGHVRAALRQAPGETESPAWRIDSPNASVSLVEDGEYRLDVAVGTGGDETWLTAFEGRAVLETDRGSHTVNAGERALARGVSAPASVPTARADAFDAWTESRLDVARPTATSAYLPGRLASHSATLDRYGSWQADAEYGSVWYPTVAADWRPYSNGYWNHAGLYGWVWVGADPWGWATHHYGRWGWRHDRWFWIPAPVWGPAWVAWGIGPGYVGWCPLGWNNRALFSIHVTGGYDRGYYGSYYGRGYNSWYGWTVLPSRHFRSGVAVRRYAIDGRRIPATDRAAFVTQRVPPRAQARAFRGAGAEYRGSSSRSAVPRGTAFDGSGRLTTAVRPRGAQGAAVGPASRDDRRLASPSRPASEARSAGRTYRSDAASSPAERYRGAAARQPDSRAGAPRRQESPVRTAPPARTTDPNPARQPSRYESRSAPRQDMAPPRRSMGDQPPPRRSGGSSGGSSESGGSGRTVAPRRADGGMPARPSSRAGSSSGPARGQAPGRPSSGDRGGRRSEPRTSPR